MASLSVQGATLQQLTGTLPPFPGQPTFPHSDAVSDILLLRCMAISGSMVGIGYQMMQVCFMFLQAMLHQQLHPLLSDPHWGRLCCAHSFCYLTCRCVLNRAVNMLSRLLNTVVDDAVENSHLLELHLHRAQRISCSQVD